MAEKCGTLKTVTIGNGSWSGPKIQKTFIQNIARQMALTDAQIKADRFINSVKCKMICPVKTSSLIYLNRTEIENINQVTGVYKFTVTIRLEVTVKCSNILSVPMKKNR